MSWNNVIPGWLAIEMFQDDPDIGRGKKRAVCILIHREIDGRHEVLAVSRKDDHTAFGLPGGKVEGDEPRLAAAVRELKEETGLIVEHHNMNPVFKHEEEDYVTTTFMPFSYRGEVQSPEGEGIARWVSPEVLTNGPFGQYNRQLFKRVGISFKD